MNNNEKEALQYLVELGQDTEKIIEIGGQPYSHLNLKRICLPSVDAVQLSTLDSFVEFTKQIIAREITNAQDLMIHVESPVKVRLIGAIRDDASREVFAETTAALPSEISYRQYYSTEDFNVNLQSRFVENEDKKLLLKFTGLIKEEAIKTVGDNGVSQQATIKTGVTTVGNAVVPNPVTLAPYRVFREVEQPESIFIFRMKDGPSAALFEADGGAWRLEAIKNVADYLKERLPEMIVLA